MIDTEGLTRKFGDLTAVNDLTLHVDDGEIFGFLGPNGAGKTTTVRMLCCLISKTSGSAKIGGYDVASKEDSLKIRRIIGLVPDNVGLSEHLTAYDNLDFHGKIYDMTKEQRKENIRRFLEMLGLWHRRDVPAGSFSKGMKQKLAIARALIHDPQILILDEPTANLDPEASKTVRDFILQLKKENKTIFLNTHNLDEAQRICDRVGIINTKLMALGSPQNLEQMVSGRRTVIELSQVTEAVSIALKKMQLKGYTVKDSKISFDISDPDSENWPAINAIAAAGGHIRSVSVAGSSLEEIYLKLVRQQA
jgi:ABC-2 type transport system ATP-binding protein